MSGADFGLLLSRCLSVFRSKTPIDTGNLRYNSTVTQQYTAFGHNVGIIYIEDEIAPYVYYTNEPWISPKWHGKKNPNEGWVDRAILAVVDEVAREADGVVVQTMARNGKGIYR